MAGDRVGDETEGLEMELGIGRGVKLRIRRGGTDVALRIGRDGVRDGDGSWNRAGMS